MSGAEVEETASGPDEFPTTRWSRLLHASQGGHVQPDVEYLARAYWRPVQAYIRCRFTRSQEEALDLCQDFFLWILESGFLGRADPQRGRFRGFIKTALANYLTDVQRKKRTLKRGGGRTFLSLSGGAEEDDGPPPIADPADKTPEQVLDEAWRTEVFQRATERLREQLVDDGKPLYFEVFREYFLDPSDEVDYRGLAERHGIDTVAVSNYLSRTKRLFRQCLRREVLDTVESPEDLDQELSWLFEQEVR